MHVILGLSFFFSVFFLSANPEHFGVIIALVHTTLDKYLIKRPQKTIRKILSYNRLKNPRMMRSVSFVV